jgi:dethiobiotin synthase
MRVIFISGSDTGIGKTHVTAAVARLLAAPGQRVQLIKAVETGRRPDEPGDAERARALSGLSTAEPLTLALFSQPLAPLTAARLDGESLDLADVLARWRKLPPADLRVVEGAGGLAVPIDPDGADWADFARAIEADRVVLAVPDRLGAINQSRLTVAYARAKGLPCGIWLNEHEPAEETVRASNREGLRACGVPLWGSQRFQATGPEDREASRAFLET